jgi:two-component system, NtrC family, sensor kinase
MASSVPKKHSSLRTLFLRWMMLFTVLPLILIVAVFANQLTSAVQEEIFERLIVYTKQIQDLFNDYETYSKSRLDSLAEDKTVLYQLKTSSFDVLSESLKKGMETDFPTAYVAYNQSGRQVLRVASMEKAGRGPLVLSEAVRRTLQDGTSNNSTSYAIYYTNGGKTYLNLNVVKKVRDESLNWEGFVEKVILVDEEILSQIKNNFGLDIIFFGPKGDVFLTSLPDEQFTHEQLSNDFLRGNNHFFDISVKGQNFGFISTAVKWGNQKFLIAIGASKTSMTKNVNQLIYLLLVALFVLLGCLGLFGYFFTQRIIQPISRLVVGVDQMKSMGQPVPLDTSNRTEIGLLTENFNEMAQKIYEYRQDLEHKVTDLEAANVEVKSAQTQLIQSAKLAGLGQLVAGVAHELNNPIGFVYSNIQHLREYTGTLINMIQELSKKSEDFDKLKKKYDFDFIAKDLPKLISSCEEGARRTRDIVTGLRNFSRSSDKDQKIFSVTDCIDSTLDLIQGATKKEKIVVEKDYSDFIPPIAGNPNQLSQVFMNIISNAYQALDQSGTIRIRAKLENPELIHIEISDDGAGISPENISKIFDPFFTTKDVGQGTGLGLSISYGIVKSHGGELTVSSELGRGTTFRIQLPVPQAKG